MFDRLATLFIGLKLTHYIDWSWWIIVSPMGVHGLLWIGKKIMAAHGKKRPAKKRKLRKKKSNKSRK